MKRASQIDYEQDPEHEHDRRSVLCSAGHVERR